MTGYTCKYTPIELFRAYGGEGVLLDEEAPDFQLAESWTHTNLCSHAKALLELGSSAEELVLTDCCDAIRRVHDVLDTQKKQRFLYLLDLPHEESDCARARFKSALTAFAAEYGAFRGTEFSRDAFLAACREQREPLPQEPFLAVLGARVSPPLLELLQAQLPLPVVNLTCSGNRNLEAPPLEAEHWDFDELMDWYAGALLRMTPCMRMNDVTARRALTEHPHLKGIIYNAVKFCDYYGFDYAALKKQTAIPILKIESDYTPQPAGQLSTRLEAFAESLGLEAVKGGITVKHSENGLFAGIDSGSTTTNMVVLDRDKKVVASAIVRTGAKAQNGAKAALDAVCAQLGIAPEALDAIIATGYGRSNIPFATGTMTEITCHAKGAHFLYPQVRTVVDIGGQDSKVICLDENGAVKNFVMNDKCAAGTGRFLEMMARTLELDMEQMSRQGLTWKKDLTISSMCTVFAESEVISLIADNHTDSDIIHGLNKAIASKTASMVTRAGGMAPYMMTGGVARNKGVVGQLEERLGAGLYIAKDPDLCGALGAALFAVEGSEE
ncbi:MAG: acyl-CoA dehydratase activase [Oscillospiraceae bacterium]|nr:acyl-CoA dehydratase activase [Oscillospiraceae bacterium]